MRHVGLLLALQAVKASGLVLELQEDSSLDALVSGHEASRGALGVGPSNFQVVMVNFYHENCGYCDLDVYVDSEELRSSAQAGLRRS